MADDIQEILIAPVASMIGEVGQSVAEAATALNVAQAAAYQNLPKELIDAGIVPSFYHMQDVEVELKMTLQIEKETSGSGKKSWRLFGSPLSAKTRAAQKTEATGSSSLKLTFAPGPVPIALDPSNPQDTGG